jgi:hypothetical protein
LSPPHKSRTNDDTIEPYYNRGVFKAERLKDYRGALADFNHVLKKVRDVQTYLARGRLKYTKLNDRAGGITDVKTALQLAKKDENTKASKIVMTQLKSWGINQGKI